MQGTAGAATWDAVPRSLRRPWLVALIALVALVALAPAACATSPPAPAPDASASGTERAFDWTVGEWVGVRRSAEDGGEAPIGMRVVAILGGAGQVRELEVRHARGVYRGVCLQVYEPGARRWVRQYVNDVRRTFARLEGRLEGGRWVWHSAPAAGGRAISRVVSERPGRDRWRRTVSRSTDGGATWSEVFTDELVRAPGPTAQPAPAPSQPATRSARKPTQSRNARIGTATG